MPSKKKTKKSNKDGLLLPSINMNDCYDGQIVWGKYKNYPYWPGMIIDYIPNDYNNKRKSKRKSRYNNNNNNNNSNDDSNEYIGIKWFGDFGKQCNKVLTKNISQWDLSQKYKIYRYVGNFDKIHFHESCDQAMNAHKQYCFENGIPIDIDGVILKFNKNNINIKKKRNKYNKKLYIYSSSSDDNDSEITSHRPSRNINIDSDSDNNSNDNDSENSDDSDMDSNNNNNKKRRRSTRLQTRIDNNSKRNNMSKYSKQECIKNTQYALELIEDTHSAEDITPFISIMYYGIKSYLSNKTISSDDKIVNTIAKIYDIKVCDVYLHLSYFTEDYCKPLKKKRKKY